MIKIKSIIILMGIFTPICLMSQPWTIPDKSFENCDSWDTCVVWRILAGYPKNISPSWQNPDYQQPQNIYGYEPAANQDNYMKIVMFGMPSYREYIGVELGTPFAAGNRLAVSFSVSRAENCQLACNNMGISFELGSWGVTGPSPSNGTDSIRIPNVVYQENGWYTYSDTFTTPFAVDRIVIGNARTDAQTTVDTVSSCGPAQAIYYVDDVQVVILPSSVGLDERQITKPIHLRSTNIWGQPVGKNAKGIRVDHYSDGTWRKVFPD